MFTRDQIGRLGLELLLIYVVVLFIFSLRDPLLAIVSLIAPLELIGLLFLIDYPLWSLFIFFLIVLFVFFLQRKNYTSQYQKFLEKRIGISSFVILRGSLDLFALLLVLLLIVLLALLIGLNLYDFIQ